jgi:AcrR family transcriptional regulator
VSVGEIEEAAGFTRRGGTLYKHFRSKDDLLDAAIARHVESLAQPDGVLALLPLPDVRSELQLIGCWILARLTAEEAISRIIEKEATRLPHLVETMRDHISEPGYALLASYLTHHGLDTESDATAMAVLLLGSLINVRRSTWTFGQPPAAIGDERAIASWVELCLLVLRANAATSSTTHRSRRQD